MSIMLSGKVPGMHKGGKGEVYAFGSRMHCTISTLSVHRNVTPCQ